MTIFQAMPQQIQSYDFEIQGGYGENDDFCTH